MAIVVEQGVSGLSATIRAASRRANLPAVVLLMCSSTMTSLSGLDRDAKLTTQRFGDGCWTDAI